MRIRSLFLALSLWSWPLGAVELPGGIEVKVPIKLPGLDKLLKEEPAITTSLQDAVTDIPFLDGFNPQNAAPLAFVPRGPEGTLTLLPGLWEVSLQSYCLHAGTHAPGRGDGYAYAPLKGPQARFVQSVLRNSVQHPEIPQSDIQTLVWAIIARTKISEMSPAMRQVAAQLLTPQEIDQLNGGALGKIPPEVLQAALDRLPPLARQVLQAEAQLRDLLTQQIAVPFEELERVAVLQGDPEPPKDSREIPWGRWCYHPEGFFVRYMPDGYPTTLHQFYVPEDIRVDTDALGRIIAISDPHGNRIETDYDDTVEALTLDRDPQVKGYALRAIRLVGPDPAQPGQKHQAEFPNVGWTWVGLPSGQGREPRRVPDRYPEAMARYRQAVEQKKQFQNLARAVSQQRGQSRPAISDEGWTSLLNLAHYAAALQAAIGPLAAGDGGWAAEQRGLVYRAWQVQFARRVESAAAAAREESRPGSRLAGAWRVRPGALQMAPGGGASQGGRGRQLSRFDPSGGAATPGNTGRQRLGQSGRKAGQEHDTLAKARRATRVTSLGTSVAWRLGTGGGAPWGIPLAGAGQILDFNFDTWGRAIDALGGDPPRGDYTLLPTLEPGHFSPLQAEGEVTPARAQAMNAFLEAACDLTAKLRAVILGWDRYGGALQAGEEDWAVRQVEALVGMERQAGEALQAVADRLESLLQVLEDEGVPDFEVTAGDLQAYRDELRRTGFRPEEIQAARALALTDAEIQASLQGRLQDDPAEVSGSVREAAREVSAELRSLGERLIRLPAG